MSNKIEGTTPHSGRRTIEDCNSVLITGTVQTPVIYRVKDQLRFGFWIRTKTISNEVSHLLPVQLQGQLAYDGLMQYQAAREVNVNGYLETPHKGRIVVIGTSVFWGRTLVPMTSRDLAEKLRLLKSVDPREQAQSLDVDSSKDDDTAKDAKEEIEPDSPTMEDGPVGPTMSETCYGMGSADLGHNHPCREFPMGNKTHTINPDGSRTPKGDLNDTISEQDLDCIRDRSGIDFDSEFTEEEMVYPKVE